MPSVDRSRRAVLFWSSAPVLVVFTGVTLSASSAGSVTDFSVSAAMICDAVGTPLAGSIVSELDSPTSVAFRMLP